MMGILLRVPELRENLEEATGGNAPDGDKLALIIKDWVNRKDLLTIADRYFKREGDDQISALTRCGQNLFGRLTQTTSWGLGALLAITASNLPEDEFNKLSNLPSRVFYGVNSDAAVTMRLLGIPRLAASSLAAALGERIREPLPKIRKTLSQLSEEKWQAALDKKSGVIYRKIWRIMEGLEK